MKTKSFTVHKQEDSLNINEDAVTHEEKLIAVSDGAGGGGVFADNWAKYLLEKLPKNDPIDSFEMLDSWIGDIWEPFYEQYEMQAKGKGGLFLTKFYEEGSLATLASAWVNEDKVEWMAYGDSVVFCYNKETDKLEHSFTKLSDFSKPPYLISCKNPLVEDGFRHGFWKIDENSIVFIASDAVAQFLILLFEVEHEDIFRDDLRIVVENRQNGNQMIENIKRLNLSFKDVLSDFKSMDSETKFSNYVYSLENKQVLRHDDYSLALMY